MSTCSAGTAAPTFNIMATVVFHSSGVCPCELVMLVKLWHAEQAPEISSLASPSGNWTSARSPICTCPRAGNATRTDPAIAQIKKDLSDITPPVCCSLHLLRGKVPPSRYKKNWLG